MGAHALNFIAKFWEGVLTIFPELSCGNKLFPSLGTGSTYLDLQLKGYFIEKIYHIEGALS